MNYKSLKELTADIDLNLFSENVFDILWDKFSEIQCATSMCLCDECKDRFVMWLKSGNDNDAWS